MSKLSYSDFSSKVQEYKNGRVILNDGQHYSPYETYTGSSKPQQNFTSSVKGIYEESSVSSMFFSKENANLIHQEIIQGVYQQTGQSISRQSDSSLQIIMRSLYLQYGKNLPCQIKEQVSELNNHVIKECLRIILPNIQQTIGYQQDLSRLPGSLDRPVNMSSTGSKMLYDKIAF